jgi:hypothetical protein
MRWVIPTSGSGTELNLLEIAMQCAEAVVNGMNLYAPRHCRTTTNRGQTPFEAEWMIEVSDQIIEKRWDRKSANEFLNRLAEIFEGKTPQDGYSITECYDLINHQPKTEYEKVAKHVRKKLTELGLAMN